MRGCPRARAALVAATAVTVVGLAGCGSTALLHRTESTTATTTSQVSTAAAPTTTTASVTTTLAQSTTTTLPGSGRPTVLVGDMNTPEQFIIGALYQDALEAQGYTVDLSHNIGATSVSQAAMSQGSLDLYPEYLNVYDSEVASDTRPFKTLAEAFSAGQRYANAHGQVLLPPTPFSDTAGIAVLSSYARAHHLHSIADLRRVQETLTLGSPLEFAVEPGGLAALEHAYHFTPAVTAVINIGGQYNALRFGTVQAAYDDTTDWELGTPRYTNLADTEHVLGFGNVVPVVSAKVLAAEGPAFADAINQVDALLSLEAIRGLTAEIESSDDPASAAYDVAQEFLQGYGIGPPPPWSTVTATTTVPTTTTTTTMAESTSTARTVDGATAPARTVTRKDG